MTSIRPNLLGTVPEPAPVRLILGEVLWGHIRAREAHHRDFPEIRAEGGFDRGRRRKLGPPA